MVFQPGCKSVISIVLKSYKIPLCSNLHYSKKCINIVNYDVTAISKGATLIKYTKNTVISKYSW